MRTYAKILVFAVMVTYFLGFIVGGVQVFGNPEHLGDWLTYTGSAAVTAISFYCWKAKAENVEKIKKSLYEEEIRRREKLGEHYESTTEYVDKILAELEEEQVL